MPLDLNKLRAKKERASGTGWTPKSGANWIRILPHTSRYFTEELAEFCHEFRSHFIRIPGEDTRVTRCYRDRKQACPVCEAVSKYSDSNDPALSKIVGDLKPSRRFLFNIVDLNNIQAGIQTYESGPMVYNDVIEYLANPRWGDIINPMDGRNWTLTLTPANQSDTGYNKYSCVPDPDRTSMEGCLPENWQELLDASESQVVEYLPAQELIDCMEKLGLSLSNTHNGMPGGPPQMMGGPRPVGVGGGPSPVPSAAPAPPVAGNGGSTGGPTPMRAPGPVSGGPSPVGGGGPAPVSAPAPAPVSMGTPAPVNVGAPAAGPQAIRPPAAAAGPSPVNSAPNPVQEPAAPPAPVPAQVAESTGAMAAPTQAGGKTYPPGLQILENNPKAGGRIAPACYQDYNPDVHPCQECPDCTECTLATLGVGV